MDLTCCVGVPVPPGQESCEITCPDSDRNLKENFASIDPQQILEQVEAMPITTWNYIAEPDDVRHLGPMAQDFSAAFGLGASDRSIHKIDADGVALAAIQALATGLHDAREENAALRRELASLKKRVAALE